MTRVPVVGILILLASVVGVGLLYQHTEQHRQDLEAQSAPTVKLERVAQAVSTTSAAPSFRFSGTVFVSGPGGTFTMEMEGANDTAHRVAEATVRVPDAPAGSGAEYPMSIVVDTSNGFVEYIHSQLFDGHLPAGKSWVKVDLGSLAKSQGVDLDAILQSQNADPSRMFDDLKRASDPTYVGQDTVGGLATTHYSATVNVERHSYPVEVWVDRDGYLRRMRVTTVVKGVTVTATQELTDFGGAVRVGVPPASDTVDVAALT